MRWATILVRAGERGIDRERETGRGSTRQETWTGSRWSERAAGKVTVVGKGDPDLSGRWILACQPGGKTTRMESISRCLATTQGREHFAQLTKRNEVFPGAVATTATHPEH